MYETIILELFTLAALTQGPGHTLHLPGGALAVFPQQDISSFATRSLHYRIISSLLFSHHRKYYLVINNSQRERKTFYTLLGCISIMLQQNEWMITENKFTKFLTYCSFSSYLGNTWYLYEQMDNGINKHS